MVHLSACSGVDGDIIGAYNFYFEAKLSGRNIMIYTCANSTGERPTSDTLSNPGDWGSGGPRRAHQPSGQGLPSCPPACHPLLSTLALCCSLTTSFLPKRFWPFSFTCHRPVCISSKPSPPVQGPRRRKARDVASAPDPQHSAGSPGAPANHLLIS